MIEHHKQTRKQTFHCVQKDNKKIQSEMGPKMDFFFLSGNSFNCIKYQIFHHYMKAWNFSLNSVVPTSSVIYIFFFNKNIYMAKSLPTTGSCFLQVWITNCKILEINHISKLRTFETQLHKTVGCDFIWNP